MRGTPVNTPATPVLTIAICTRNRATLLSECLSALHEQVAEMTEMQLLVVDNGSTDDTAQLVAGFRERFPMMRLVVEEDIGLSHARNRALSESACDWIAFLDDDARPLAGYVARLRYLVGKDMFDSVGGVYLPWYRDGRKAWFRDAYGSNASVIKHFGALPVDRNASGGNWLLRRSAALAVGGFRPDLGMAGGRIGYGEETRLQIELRRRGYRVGGDPDLVVEHLVPMRKQSLLHLMRSAWAVGRDHWATFDAYPTTRVMLGRIRRLLTRPLISLYNEIVNQPEPCNWRTLLLAFGRPLLMTLSELVAALRLILQRGR
jgi:glycosyltransferase involved in cell wall biosynthesis